ncbi:hypothetical protein E2562_020419 [Oryza meyeriana var. granulata]|uniref:Uncharacterized protein n=1 Tax=Oryza meyeriana var. granulata TaxID=110450 RepID=A0A6G1D5E5_9ORYZ|nr:hypothetical protein E2562_020419 [Oryza meyeriana var. granulata]
MASKSKAVMIVSIVTDGQSMQATNNLSCTALAAKKHLAARHAARMLGPTNKQPTLVQTASTRV